jgi:hypothetical protein
MNTMREEPPAGAAGGSLLEEGVDGEQRREDDPQSNIAATPGKRGEVAGAPAAMFRRGAYSVAATARTVGSAQAEARRVAAAAKEKARKEAAAAFLKHPTVFADQVCRARVPDLLHLG